MAQPRTDLAAEQLTAGLQTDIIRRVRGTHFSVTELEIPARSDYAARPGRYITLETPSLGRMLPEFEGMANELAQELAALLPDTTSPVLVLGLGNSDITPDALGPRTAERVLATRHLRGEIGDADAFLSSLRPVSVLAGGVLGQTGIEAAELAHALTDTLRPGAVIAVDALACADTKRLGTTIQLSDTGIAPGSGVQNRRKELSRAFLGVPVIAVGVPTVVDLHTIVRSASDHPPRADTPNFMVTPRDIDTLIQNAARLIACGINLALHPQLDLETAEAMTG